LICISLLFSSIGYGAFILAGYKSAYTHDLLILYEVCIYLSPLILGGAINSRFTQHQAIRWKWNKLWFYALVPIVALASVYLFFLPDPLLVVYSRFLFSFVLFIFILSIVLSIKPMMEHVNERFTKGSLFLSIFVYTASLILLLFDVNESFVQVFNSIGLLGMAITILAMTIFQQGERWIPDFLYSFDYFVFLSFPELRQERSRLRTIESVKLVVDEQLNPAQMKGEELFRMVRRAFRHFEDLQRLSANPLTQLEIIEQRLQKKEKQKIYWKVKMN
jgi:hypothetical protein